MPEPVPPTHEAIPPGVALDALTAALGLAPDASPADLTAALESLTGEQALAALRTTIGLVGIEVPS